MSPGPHQTDRPVAALLVPDILALLSESPGDVAAETEEMHPADLADVVEAMPHEHVMTFLRALPPSRAAQVVEYLDEEVRTELLEHMTSEQAAEIISEMTPDDRADVLEELEKETAGEILSDLPDEARQETERLMQFGPDTAGGIMTTQFVSVPASLYTEDALQAVRTAARSGRRDSMHAIYAVDDDGRLIGAMSLRELVAAPEHSTVADIMTVEPVSVPTSADRAEVARMTSNYDLVAVPVVDGFGRLVGVVTVDDVIDVIEKEQTEDVHRLGGVQPLDEPYFMAGFWNVARKRAGWLIFLFLGEMFTGTAMRVYEDTLAQAIVLTLFIPLIISSGGNSGSQSATLITRALAVGDVELRDVLRVLFREIGQGMVLGVVLGAIGFVRVLLWGQTSVVATAVSIALVLIVIVGSTVGALLPLLFKRLGFDPAVASAPFVASLVDVTGLVIYFNVARYFLGLQ